MFFDADNDGDNDLYVVSGGAGLPPDNKYYADRLYINDGNGNLAININALPDERVCGSQVTAADFDKDGDLDLFVCGRVSLENYPIPPRSFLLRNDSKGSSVKFTDITDFVSSDLERPGLLTSALWTDFNKDGWPDLILTGEWMPVTFYKNEKGRLINITGSTGLDKYTGWWNSLTAADFDKDGDIDYAAGNFGLNSQYKVSQDQPMRIVAKDFDNNGMLDPVCSYYVQGKSYPIYHRNLLLMQIPSLRNRFKTYEDYAKASMDDIFPENTLNDAYIRDSRFFASAWIENVGNGSFRMHSLPLEAQTAPVFGMLTNDYNNDGNADLLLVGNYYSFNVYEGQQDAFIGLLLAGDGKGNFSPVQGRETGFFVDGDAKALAELVLKDGNSIVLAAQNSDSLKVFKPIRQSKKSLRIENDVFSAELLFNNGTKEYVEFYYGSGYLSQSSRVLRIPEDVDNISLTSFRGEKRIIKIK